MKSLVNFDDLGGKKKPEAPKSTEDKSKAVYIKPFENKAGPGFVPLSSTSAGVDANKEAPKAITFKPASDVLEKAKREQALFAGNSPAAIEASPASKEATGAEKPTNAFEF